MNTIDASFSESEIVHMLNITKPKAIFCDADIIGVVKDSLRAVNNDANIFTFCGAEEGSTAVANLLTETGQEDKFM